MLENNSENRHNFRRCELNGKQICGGGYKIWERGGSGYLLWTKFVCKCATFLPSLLSFWVPKEGAGF